MAASTASAQAPPVPGNAPASSVEERLKALEESNRALAEQNRKLQSQLETLIKKDSAEAKPAGDKPAGGAASDTGETADGLPPRSDRSNEGGAGARDNPAERSARDKTGPSKIPMKVGFGPGLVMESEDGEYQVQFHNQTQIESRIYQQGGMEPAATGFYVARQRLIFQGRITKPLEYEGSVEAAYGSINLLNAFLTYHPNDKFLVKAGRFKVPFQYEYYAISNADLLQPERSLFGTNFGLNRMPGAMVYGSVADKRIDYSIGIFDGPRNQLVDFNNEKDVIAYLNFKPFLNNEDNPLRYLNFGGSVDQGNQGNPIIPQALRTSLSQSTNTQLNLPAPAWLAFNNGVTETGWRSLYSLHAAYYYKGFSAYAEWQSGFTNYDRNSKSGHSRVPIDGFYVSTGYLVGADGNDRRSQIKPYKPFDLRPEKFGLGAVEFQARYSQLTLGQQVFNDGLADPNLWSNSAYTIDTGLNWYLNQYVKIYLDWQHAEFGQPAQFAPGRRELTSDLFWLRAQLYF